MAKAKLCVQQPGPRYNQPGSDLNLAIEQFLAVVAHELRSPLNGIQSWAHVLESQLDADASSLVQRALVGIRTGIDQQVRLLEDLMDSALVLGDDLRLAHQVFDLRALLDATWAELTEAAVPRQIVARADVRFERAPLLGDPARVRQILAQLFSNALRYTPAGGSIDLAALLVHPPGSDRCMARIKVTDSGCGIAREDLSQVFEPLRRAEPGTRPRQAGVGLGLAVLRKLVHLHGGQVACNSAGPGCGSEFTVYLPLHRLD